MRKSKPEAKELGEVGGVRRKGVLRGELERRPTGLAGARGTEQLCWAGGPGRGHPAWPPVAAH